MSKRAQKFVMALLAFVLFTAYLMEFAYIWRFPPATYVLLLLIAVEMLAIIVMNSATLLPVAVGSFSLVGLLVERLHVLYKDMYSPWVWAFPYVILPLGACILLLREEFADKKAGSLENICVASMIAVILCFTCVAFGFKEQLLNELGSESEWFISVLQWIFLALLISFFSKFLNLCLNRIEEKQERKISFDSRRIYDVSKFLVLFCALFLSLAHLQPEKNIPESVSESIRENVQNSFNLLSILVIEYAILDIFWQDSGRKNFPDTENDDKHNSPE